MNDMSATATRLLLFGLWRENPGRTAPAEVIEICPRSLASLAIAHPAGALPLCNPPSLFHLSLAFCSRHRVE